MPWVEQAESERVDGRVALLVAGAALMMVLVCVCAAPLIQILATPGRLAMHQSSWNRLRALCETALAPA